MGRVKWQFLSPFPYPSWKDELSHCVTWLVASVRDIRKQSLTGFIVILSNIGLLLEKKKGRLDVRWLVISATIGLMKSLCFTYIDLRCGEILEYIIYLYLLYKIFWTIAYRKMWITRDTCQCRCKHTCHYWVHPFTNDYRLNNFQS